MHDIEALVKQLPFSLHDTAAVNAVFREWYAQRQPTDLKAIEIWTYCFIRRYAASKFVRDGMSSVSDVDEMVATLFSKIRKGREKVRADGHYASWVSVVCRNAYLNYVRKRLELLVLEEDWYESDDQGPEDKLDAALLFEAVDAAVERLPQFLRDVARLRFLEDASYEEISEVTSKSLPIIRSYVAKAAAKIREDLVFLIAIDRNHS